MSPADPSRAPETPPSSADRETNPSLNEVERQRQIDDNKRAALDQSRALSGRISAARRSLDSLRIATANSDERAVNSSRKKAAARQAQAAREAQRRFAESQDRLGDAVVAALGSLAPGPAGCPVSGLATPGHHLAPAEYQRIGLLQDVVGAPAALLPLVGHHGWKVTGDRASAVEIVRTAVARIIAQIPLRHVALHVFDPRITGVLGGFAPLRQLNAATFPAPSVDARAFEEVLSAVLTRAAQNAELVTANGASSFAEHWRRLGNPQGCLSVVVVLDYPLGIDDRISSLLTRAVALGPANGVVVLFCEPSQPGGSAGSTKVPSDLEMSKGLRRIEVGRTQAAVADWPDVVVELDPPLTDGMLTGLLAGIEEVENDWHGPSLELRDVIGADVDSPWTGSAAESLDVSVGRIGKEKLDISLRTANPPHPNMLLGGAVGQGKSNLLLDLVYGLAARYSPQELEFYLLDFKRGLEFKRFDADSSGESWLPHVRVLGLESNHAFGVAVLQHVHDEMERRSRMFKQYNAGSLAEFRARSGEILPRVVLVVDEFHVLFEGDENYVDRCVALTEALAKQGRAYGVHLVFASQTVSGIRALAAKADAIFGQFPLRLSLKNTAAESQALLSQGNKEAAELTYRGEVVLNRNFGMNPDEDNVRGLCAYADPEYVVQLQRTLWLREHGARPMVFVGTEYAQLDARVVARHNAAARRQTGLTFLLGRPVAVTDQPRAHTMLDDSDQSVALLGADDELVSSVLFTTLLTAMGSLASGRLVILDGRGDLEQKDWFTHVLRAAQEFDVEIEIIDRDDAMRFLAEEVLPRLDADRCIDRMLVVSVGTQRLKHKDEQFDCDPSLEAADEYTYREIPTGRTLLRRLVREGAIANTFFFGTWATPRTAEEDLGMNWPGIGLFITAGLGLEDVRSLAGHSAGRVDGSPRVGLVDRATEGLETVVPFALVGTGIGGLM